MLFNYINFMGFINKLFLNGLILKYFFNIFVIYQIFIYYNFFYKIQKGCQKNKSFINFSKRKIYKQKGTGKSRIGSLSSPTRIKGAKSFPNIYYTNFRLKCNKIFYKISFFIIYSNLISNNYFYIIEDIFFIENKTKLMNFYFKKFLNNLNYYNFKFLILTTKIEKNFFLSINNFSYFKLVYLYNFNPILTLKFSKILISKSCLELLFNND